MYQKERLLINRFIKAGILNGEWTKELKVGFPKPSISKRATDATGYTAEACLSVCCRKIDLVCRDREETWLLEAKLRLVPSAIGQLLVYRTDYRRSYPDDKNKICLGIITLTDDAAVRAEAERQGIKIFVLNEL